MLASVIEVVFIGLIFILSILAERNEIHAKFSESILDMQQKSGLKYMVLEKKITSMREELDIKDAQMHEIVKVSQASDRGIFVYVAMENFSCCHKN